MATLEERIVAQQDKVRTLMTPTPSVPISGLNELPDVNVDAPSDEKRVLPTSEDGAAGPSAPGFAAGTPTGNELPSPTPNDPLPDQIEARRKQTFEALKADGFDGYVPNVTEGGANFTPEESAAVIKAVQDFGAGFNVSLARTLSLPREVVDRGMGMLGADYLEHGSPTQQTINTLNRMGIPAYEVETLANKIGRGSLPALATSAAMQLMAPAMAARTGVGTMDILIKNIGEWLVKNPVFAQWVGQTSQAGGETAVHVTGVDNNTVRFGGEVLGGATPFGGVKGAAKLTGKVLGTVIPGSGPAARAGVKAVGKGINAISDALPQDLGNVVKKYNPFYKPAPTPSNPLVTGSDNSGIQTFAQNQIASAQHFQDLAIERAVNSVQTTNNPAQNSRLMHEALLKAEKISKGIVQSFWNKVPKKSRMNVSELRRDVIAFRNSLRDLDNQRPDEMFSRVMQTVALQQEAGSGKFMAPMPTLNKILDLKSQIGRAITLEKANDAPREGMIRNLTQLNEIIDNAVSRAFPNSTSIEQARQMSKRHNDLFSRGPIDAILSKRRSGEFRTPQAEAVDKLLERTDGLKALKDVQEGILNYPKEPFTKRASAADKQVLDGMIKNAQDSIRSTWRELMDQSPTRGIAYSQRNEDEIRALGTAAGELQYASQRVKAALDAKKQIDASSLAKFAETDGSKAVKNIFAQRDPATFARQLMVSFRGDDSALAGLRDQTLQEFIYVIGKGNPNIISRNLKEPKFRNLLDAVLDGDQMERLERMTATAVRLGVEDVESVKNFWRAPLKTAGRIVGAHIGRKIAPGQLQAPSIAANAASKFMEGAMQSTDPEVLFKYAVLDPNWEALLHSRIPADTKDMRKAVFWYKRIFQSINVAEQNAINKFYDGQEHE
jgi:hypothetical protein